MKLPIKAKHVLAGFIFIAAELSASTLYAQTAKLIDYWYIGDFNKDVATLTLQKSPPLDRLPITNNLRLYKIHYNTHAPDGKLTSASGLVALPISPVKTPGIVTYMHGTRVTRNDVPSNMTPKNYIYPAVFGSSGGYVLAMPDYLGLGDSSLPLHPYVQADTLASSSIDMLIATQELVKKFNYATSSDIYLAGYSEGGYTTMVTYEEMLKNHPELPVTAVSPGSAPYDWNETTNFIILQPGPRATVYLAYFFYSLQTYGNLWQGLDEIFRAPYATMIPVLFDGQHQSQEIIDALPQDPRLIFQPNFIESVLDGTDRNAAELKRNFNHYDFKSTAPLLLIGTKGDHDVPYHGSEIAYEVLKAKSDKVQIKSVSDNLDHLQAFPYITKEQLEFFQQ